MSSFAYAVLLNEKAGSSAKKVAMDPTLLLSQLSHYHLLKASGWPKKT